jgi:hypothetical protein
VKEQLFKAAQLCRNNINIKKDLNSDGEISFGCGFDRSLGSDSLLDERERFRSVGSQIR